MCMGGVLEGTCCVGGEESIHVGGGVCEGRRVYMWGKVCVWGE